MRKSEWVGAQRLAEELVKDIWTTPTSTTASPIPLSLLDGLDWGGLGRTTFSVMLIVEQEREGEAGRRRGGKGRERGWGVEVWRGLNPLFDKDIPKNVLCIAYTINLWSLLLIVSLLHCHHCHKKLFLLFSISWPAVLLGIQSIYSKFSIIISRLLHRTGHRTTLSSFLTITIYKAGALILWVGTCFLWIQLKYALLKGSSLQM